MDFTVQSSRDWRFTADVTGTAVLLMQETRLTLEGADGVMGRSVVVTPDGDRVIYCAAITRPAITGATY